MWHITLVLLVVLAGCSGRVHRLPSTAADLPPCASPSCVSSEATDPAHHVEAIPYSGDHLEAMRRLRAVIEGLPRTRITDADDLAIQAEVGTRMFGLGDDVECVIDPQAHVIAIRSAARFDYADCGTSRKRVEQIRAAFLESNT